MATSRRPSGSRALSLSPDFCSTFRRRDFDTFAATVGWALVLSKKNANTCGRSTA